MKISISKPPNYEKIISTFPVDGQNVCFAYGDTIFAPNGGDIPKDLLVHEVIHGEQQQKFGGPEEWWDRYLTDKEFRLEQEIPAYASQYVYYKRLYLTRASDIFLDGICHDLSSEMYGNIISFDKAKSRIKHFVRTMV